jgi:MATE family multidrug resistance protein
MLFLEVLCFELNTLFAGMLGPVELATQTILTNTESCFFMIPLGISVACAARVGQLLGRGRPVAANRAVRISLGISCFLVVVMIICFLMAQDMWVKQFTVNPAVKTIFPLILPVQILVFFLNAIQGVLSGAIRGCGRQSQGFLYNILAFWVVALPWAMCFTFLWGWGLFGLWNGINMGLSLQVLAMLLFFSRYFLSINPPRYAPSTNSLVASESFRYSSLVT